MSDRPARAFSLDVDTFRAAVGFSVLSGALALALPFLTSLCVALVAIAVAAWVWERPPSMLRPATGTRRALGVAWGLAVAGAAAFALLPTPWSEGRGLALGLGLVPLWWVDRRSHPSNLPRRTEA
jgi:hypothetical protein